MKYLNLIKLFLVCISIFTSNSIYSQINKYGEGAVIFCVFDLEKENVEKCSPDKFAEVISIEKYENAYDIVCKDERGVFNINFIRVEGIGLENYEYIDSQSGDKYVIKDLLDTSVKALDTVNTNELSDKGISSNYRMVLRFLIN